MPKYCSIEVHYIDGKVETFFGGLHAGKEVLRIWPMDGDSVSIPMCNVRKYITMENERWNGK